MVAVVSWLPWGVEIRGVENSAERRGEGGDAWALGWPPFCKFTHNNQLTVGVDDGGGVGEDVWQGWNVWGDAVSPSTKIMREEDGAIAVGCRHSMKGHNNQLNIGILNGDDIGEGT